MMSINDERGLLKKLKSGDTKAFDILYNTYHKKLFAFILKFTKNWHDSEDLLQKIFVIIWQKRENINENKSFNSYLFTIARNEIYDLLNKKVIFEFHDDFIKNITEKIDDGIREKEIVEEVYKLIQQLPEQRRKIFLMSREKGYTYIQIAEILNISENTVDTQIRNSLNYLRKKLPQIINPLVILLLTFFSKY